MLLTHYPEDKFKTQIKQLIGRHLDLNKHQVIVFGSRASGKASPQSDIDIGILGPKPLPTRIIGQIKDEVQELPILYKIDVVDFAGASSKFRQVALQTYERL